MLWPCHSSVVLLVQQCIYTAHRHNTLVPVQIVTKDRLPTAEQDNS